MRVDKVIFSCDDSAHYLKLWEYVSRVCAEVLDVVPVLFHITNEDCDFYKDKYGIVKKIKKLPNYKSSIQAQFYRIYGTSFFPDETCLVSDIDMLTPNKDYFIEQVKKYEDDCFIIYSSDVYNEELPFVGNMFCKNRMPMCYFLGTGKVYNKIFEIDSNFCVFMKKSLSYDFGYDVPYGDRDEIYTGFKINEKQNEIEIIKLKRGVTDVFNIPNRVEKKDFFKLGLDKTYDKKIIDLHIPNDYENKIFHFQEIFNKIIETYKY